MGGEASWPASEDEQEEPAVAPGFGGADGGQIVPEAPAVAEEEEQDDFEEVFAALDALVEPSVGSTSGTSEKESEGSSSSPAFDSDPGNPYWAGLVREIVGTIVMTPIAPALSVRCRGRRKPVAAGGVGLCRVRPGGEAPVSLAEVPPGFLYIR
jgi:hypothetical protein